MHKDVLEFIDSTDIRTFHQKTVFTPAQQAVLVMRSGKKTVEAIEDIVPLYNTKLCVNVPEKIHHVYLAPQMTELKFENCEDGIFCTIPEMECHQIVVFEYE